MPLARRNETEGEGKVPTGANLTQSRCASFIKFQCIAGDQCAKTLPNRQCGATDRAHGASLDPIGREPLRMDEESLHNLIERSHPARKRLNLRLKRAEFGHGRMIEPLRRLLHRTSAFWVASWPCAYPGRFVPLCINQDF
jgi:hypothetical protein